MKKHSFIQPLLVFMIITTSLPAIDLQTKSTIDQEFQQIRYEYTLSANDNAGNSAFLIGEPDANQSDSFADDAELKRRSPLLAFLASAAVPGLGQLYNGHKKRAIAFFGAEVTVWAFNRKFDSDGDSQTDEFQAFSRAHWSRTVYEDEYKWGVYGIRSDQDSLSFNGYFGEISHRLDETETQQYFELTGKYNQYAWGWDDAFIVNSAGDTTRIESGFMFDSSYVIMSNATTPVSARRIVYEGMRDKANDSYSKATNMVSIAMLNRVVSSLEAYFSAKSYNKGVKGTFGDFAGVKVRPSIKSKHSALDTPYLKLSYKF